MNLQPLGDRVVIKPLEEDEVTAGGIVLPDTAKERPQRGEVMAVGNGRLLNNGERVKVQVAVGDKVLYAKFGGTEVKIDGQEYLIMNENDVLAVLS